MFIFYLELELELELNTITNYNPRITSSKYNFNYVNICHEFSLNPMIPSMVILLLPTLHYIYNT